MYKIDDNYFANESGTIYSNISGSLKPLVSNVNSRGYCCVSLHGKSHLVHRLIAQAFLGNVSGKVINHIDGNKLNNAINNLEIVTQKENIQHSHNTGLTPVGENHSRSKISDDVLIEMILDIQSGLSTRKASCKYDLTQSYISKVMRKIYRKDIWDKL